MHVALFSFFLLLPLVFFSGAHQEFELPKYAFLLVSTGILTVVRAYEFFFQKLEAQLMRSQKIFLTLIGIGVCFLALHTFFSVSPYGSFWGSYERHQGLLYILVLAYLFLLIYVRRWSESHVRTVFLGIIIGGALASLIALLQILPGSYLPSFLYATDQTLGRIFGTMGHPNFLGQYIMLSLGLHYIFLTRSSFYRKNEVLLVASIFLHCTALLYTGNRASIIAIVLVGILMVLISIWKKRTILWKMLFLMAISVLILLIAFVWIYKMGFDGFQRSLTSRIHLYPAVLDAIRARIWFGYGLDSFGYAFTPWFPVGMGETEAFMHLPDKAHNIVLDMLFQIGVIGSVFFAGLTVFFLRMLRTVTNHVLVRTYVILIVSAGVSYMAGFPAVSDSVLLVIVSAQIGSLVSVETAKPMTGVWKVLLYGLFLPVVVYIGISTFVADVAYKKAKVEPGEHTFLQVLSIAPDPYEYIIYGSSMLTNKEDQKRFLMYVHHLNPFDIMPQLQMLFQLPNILTTDEKKILRINVESQCVRCPMVQYYLTYSFLKDTLYEDAIRHAEKYMELLPTFVKKYRAGDTSLTTYEQERLRIFLKENQEYFPHMRELVEKNEIK